MYLCRLILTETYLISYKTIYWLPLLFPCILVYSIHQWCLLHVGHLIGMIKTIVWDIRYYLFILFVVLYGFSQALFVLSYDSPAGSDFSSADTALLNAFSYMNGGAQYPPIGISNPSLAIFIVVLLVFFATIIMLNLLISLMGNSYAKVSR